MSKNEIYTDEIIGAVITDRSPSDEQQKLDAEKDFKMDI